MVKKQKRQSKAAIKRIFEIASVLLIALVVILIIFAGFHYGFSIIKKNVNANVVSTEESKADSVFIPVMLVVFSILMIFILVQVLRLYKQIRGIKEDILQQ